MAGASRKRVNTLKKKKELRFDKARRVTPEETEAFRKGIEKKLGIQLPRRPVSKP